MNGEKPGLSPEDLAEYRELSALQDQMRRMLIERYQLNLRAFARYLPEIAAHFATYKPTETLEFFCTHNGVPNLYLADRKEVFYKVSDPLKLCEEQVRYYLEEHPFEQVKYRNERDFYGQIHYRYVNACVNVTKAYPDRDQLTPAKVGSLPNCVMLGLGLGYQLDFLYSSVEVANLLVVEPDENLFYASLHAFNWAPLLEFLVENHAGIKLLVGAATQELFSELYSFYDRHGRFLSGFCFNYVHYHSEAIEVLKAELKRDYSRNFQALGFFDDHLFALSHGAAAFKAGASLLRADVSLPASLREVPVFLVGSGPSLDRDLTFLRRHQDRALIFACGTALDCLYHAGVVPDFYCCTERTPDVAYSLELIYDPAFFDQVTLLATDVVHPRVLRLFKRQALFAKLDEPFFWFELFRHPELKKWRPAIMINPLVGNMGLSGALHLGFKRLYLFGYDNGKRSEYQGMHSKEAALYQTPGAEQGGNYQLTQKAPANFGGEVQTNKLYLLSIRLLEDLLRQFGEQVHCTNCSDGARIEGARPCKSAELEEDFAGLPGLDKEGFMAYLRAELTLRVPCSEFDFTGDFDQEGFDRCTADLIDMLRKRPASRTGCVELMQSVSEYISTLNEDPRHKGHGYMLYGTLQSIFLMALRALYHSQEEQLCLADWGKIITYAEYFLADARALYRKLPDYVLGEHYQALGGRLGLDHEGCKAPPLPPLRVPPPGTLPGGGGFQRRYQ